MKFVESHGKVTLERKEHKFNLKLEIQFCIFSSKKMPCTVKYTEVVFFVPSTGA